MTATVAVTPIGAISYLADVHILDNVGLVSPAVTRSGKTTPEKLLRKAVLGHERHDASDFTEKTEDKR